MILELWYCERFSGGREIKPLGITFTKEQAMSFCEQSEIERCVESGLDEHRGKKLIWQEHEEKQGWFKSYGYISYCYHVRPIMVGERL